MNVVAKLDATLVVTRPLWRWAGQAALVILGTHLAADRLDDHLAQMLAELPVAWPSPQTPFDLGTLLALALELAVAAWVVHALARATDDDIAGPREWVQRLSVHNVLGPLFWIPVSLAGSWVIAMAVEDALPLGDAARWVGYAVATLVAWRLALTGAVQLVVCAPVPRRRSDGLFWAVPLVLVGTYATWYGLPIWGWL